MPIDLHILAESDNPPLKLIVAGIGIAIWILSAAIGSTKKKENPAPAPKQRGRQTDESRRLQDLRDRLMNGNRSGPPPLPQHQQQKQQKQQSSRKQKKQRQQQVAPAPVRAMPAAVESTATTLPGEIGDAPAHSSNRPRSETATNVRLLLQRGTREAFVLSEILGKPKCAP